MTGAVMPSVAAPIQYIHFYDKNFQLFSKTSNKFKIKIKIPNFVQFERKLWLQRISWNTPG
jgi:hypothetical protein